MNYICLSFQRGLVRLGVRTSDFHSGNRGSIPLRGTKKAISTIWLFLFLKQKTWCCRVVLDNY